tara:strand:- start:8 stop:2095 length:2088 start_codon:yes stop_codon:yes gene_type:complete
MADFILELLSEEIPSRMQKQASLELMKQFKDRISIFGVKYEEVEVHFSSRRISLIIYNIASKSDEIISKKVGPRVDSPKNAILGFLRSNNIDNLDKCSIISDKKGERYQFIEKTLPKLSKGILSEIIKEIIFKFPWPKSMRWGDGNLKWVRPLRNILAIMINDNEIETLDLSIENIIATNYTYGHRFIRNNKIVIESVSHYFKSLEDHFVILQDSKRKDLILTQINHIEKKYNVKVIDDQALLDEVSGLVEWPIVLLADFNKDFLSLPPEVLQTSMRSHQKYFSVIDQKSCKLTNKFVLVSNIISADQGASIILGNQRVLSARLHDAKYFWEKDLSNPLEENLKLLEKVTYHQKLGSLSKKVERIEEISKDISSYLNTDINKISIATKLIKNDLLSEMVGEFPELQGVMGRYYAIHQGYDLEICDSIKNHYLPNSPKDPTPNEPISYVLSIADKLDSLVCFWSIGEKPTGSKDPFALRRAGNGIIRNIIDNKLDIELNVLINNIFIKSDICQSDQKQNIPHDLTNFLKDRMKSYILEKGMDINLFDSIIKLNRSSNYSLIYRKLIILDEFRKDKKGEGFLRALKRVNNILEPNNDKIKKDKKHMNISEDLLHKKVEKDLYLEILNLKKQEFEKNDMEKFKEFLYKNCNLSMIINDFFDNIIVNDKNNDLRMNRLHLLSAVIDLTSDLFDIKSIEI